MTIRAYTLVALAACHGAPSADTGSDALLAPPDGDAACGAPIAFDTWTYAMHAIAGFTQPITHPTFLASDRVVFESNGHLFESSTDGDATPIASLDLPDSSILRAPSAAPGGDLFWFERRGGTNAGVYLAVRSGGDWVAMRAQLGPDVALFEPGAAAFHAGSVRMVALSGNDVVSLIEIESHDGIAWSSVGAIAAVMGADPALTPDGCQLLVTTPLTNGRSQIYVSDRQVDGTFAPPVPASSIAARGVGGPTLDPTRTKLWFVQAGQIVQGTP